MLEIVFLRTPVLGESLLFIVLIPSVLERERTSSIIFFMESTQTICFDADWTLVKYKLKEFVQLCYQDMVTKIAQKGYDSAILQHPSSESPENHVVSGLVADLQTGFLLKLDKNYQVLKAYQGFEEVSRKTLQETYGIPSVFELSNPQNIYVKGAYFVFVANFCLGLQLAFRVGVQRIKEGALHTSYASYMHEALEVFATILEDQNCGFYKEVVAKPANYVIQQPELVPLLRNLRSSGKKLGVITNSPGVYAKVILKQTLGEDWEELFDFVVVDSCKPSFFLETPEFCESEGFLQYGNWESLQLQKELGSTMYVGDHYLGDIYAPKLKGLKVTGIFEEVYRELGLEGVVSKELTSNTGAEYETEWGSIIGPHGEGLWWNWVIRYSDLVSTSVKELLSYLTSAS